MNVMKKLLALMLALSCVFALCACAAGENEEETSEQTELDTAIESSEETTQEQTQPTGTGYTVYVVDEDGNPVGGGIIQFCLESCTPVVVDENGVALFNGEEANYDVKFLSMPAGYTYSTEEEVFHFAEGSYELTIVLKPEA